MMIVAVFGGIVLNDLRKLAFGRPRPDLVYQAIRVSFQASQRHAELSATLSDNRLRFWRQNQSSFKIGSLSHCAGGARDDVL
jgi:hypothetical protein